jgi:hypothetical protein
MSGRKTLAVRGLACAIAALTFGACASGGGISGTSLVYGHIAGFGSIIVSGIAFDTTNAIVTIEGDPATVDDLRLGMVVLVRGSANERKMTGVADRVAADHLLQGTVEGVNAIDGTFSALSQLIVTDAGTVFDQVTLGSLTAGDSVEVFGFRDGDLSIHATRVQKLSELTEIELTGPIADLDETAMTFTIGLLTVDYSDALVELTGGPLANGLLVEVEASEQPVDDVLVVDGVESVDSELMAEPGASIGVEGFVTQVVGPDEFVVNSSQHVVTTPATRFEGGTAADLALNARVDIDGTLDAFGVLIADEIEFVTPIAAR